VTKYNLVPVVFSWLSKVLEETCKTF